MNKETILHKWLNNEATPEEIAQLKADPEYASYLKIADSSSSFDIPEMDFEANLKAISEKKKPPLPTRNPKIFSIVWKVAAVLAVVLVGYFYLSTLNTSVETDVAQTKTIVLPDGSEVTLNARSMVSYNKNNWDVERKLSLKGEAFFRVSKGKKFTVLTAQGTVQVLGTQFNVFARDSVFDVSCFEGLVGVAFNDTLVKLPAGESLQTENGKIVTAKIIETGSPSWLSNESSFENAPLNRVVEELERQYAITVSLQNVDGYKRFTGSFAHNNLEVALQAICEPLQLQYKINENGAVSIIDAKNSK